MAEKKTLRGNFSISKNAEKDFYRQLKKVAQVSGGIIDSHVEGVTIKQQKEMQATLERYSKQLEPWARRQSQKLLEQVKKSNKRAYTNKSKAIGRALRNDIGEFNVELVSQALLNEQVGLIKSIPIEAGLRAQKIALQAVVNGTRATPNKQLVQQLKSERLNQIEMHNQFAGLAGTKELEEEMSRTTEVAINRAMLIARTETARATASINQARALAVGSSQYRWHNSADGAVRDSHKFYKGKKLQGMIFSWDNPPTLDDGMKGHPGTFPNCRCFAEPVFDDE